MRALIWLLRAFIFFSLFAFSLNNAHPAQLNWFFGHAWLTRMDLIVLGSFAAGVGLGLMAMMPSWWRYRRQALAKPPEAALSPDTPSPAPTAPRIPDGI